jgi:hypothetical protein
MDGLVMKKPRALCGKQSSRKKVGFASLYRQSALRIIRAASIKKALASH